MYTHSNKRDISKRVYDAIPIPAKLKGYTLLVTELVKKYLRQIESDMDKAKMILLEIDALIMRLYDLPARLEKQILNLFYGKERPVPFDFKGYPKEGLNTCIKPTKLPKADLNSQVIEFSSQRDISEYLETSLDIINRCFPLIRDLHILQEQDPETDQQWILIDIKVNADIDEILLNYDNYIDEWVSSVPEFARENIRLSYSIY